MDPDFQIRNLTKDDIKQMSRARKEQETENGNGATDVYLENYEKILEKLFDEKRLLATGAFRENQLVSLACFNLINYGSDKKIPYLCAVWTDPSFRGIGLASRVNETLTESMLKIRDQLQPRTLLTLEGTDAALHLYKKIGYVNVPGEMTFLGDVQNTNIEDIEKSESHESRANKHIIYSFKDKPVMQISFSEEQFFSHPTNLDGKMNRITSIKALSGITSPRIVNLFLQQFFSEHRFCKFNVQELAKQERKLYDILGVDDGNIEGLLSAFTEMNFIGIDGQSQKIKRSSGIMEKDLSRDFDKADSFEDPSIGE